jgi:hypothetical protein
MLASFPASMLNQKSSNLGILNRFKLDPSRSSLPAEREEGARRPRILGHSWRMKAVGTTPADASYAARRRL